MEDSFARAKGSSFKISVDLGPVLIPPADPAKLNMRYTTANGSLRTKTLPPQTINNLRSIPSDRLLKKRMAPFLDVLARYSSNVGTIFLADEPYLNAISKTEIERAARLARIELNARQLNHVKIDVIFASGIFDREFARMIDKRSGAYVNGIDEYYAKGDKTDSAGFQAWKKIIQENRLATYDRAGNLYVDGGLPRGFDVFGFDFYLSTLLFDSLHEHTLEWMAKNYPQYGCEQFSGQSMKNIRSRLSFFRDGSVLQGEQYRIDDRKILDAMYECRMGTLTAMLKKHAPRGAELLMISESSNNGVLEFDANGNIEQKQPDALVAARVLDEVKRAQNFYKKNKSTYSGGLIYFTYQNEYDSSIKLQIGGASSMPGVMQSIYQFAADEAGVQ